MELFAKLLLIGLVFGLAWSAFQPRYVFLLRIERGEPRIAKGKVTPAFLQQVSEIGRRAGVTPGWVGGVWRGRRIALVFSRSWPSSCQQQLRNQWVLEG
jgi:hypothetical protein